MLKKTILHAVLFIFLYVQGFNIHAQESKISLKIEKDINGMYKHLNEVYTDLHSNPELSLAEKNTSDLLTKELKAAGFEVSNNVGGYGIVGVLKNGKGPVILIRTDMDALPVEEKTGVSYASSVKAKDKSGRETGVMHACGHDLHMTVFSGVAKVLSENKNSWKGTLVLVGQPAEEIGKGARMMFDAGLYKNFPFPDYAVALHSNAFIPAGKLGIREGFTMAGVDWIDMTVFGESGHGAAPQNTKDPIVLASQIVLALQTIASREIDPTEAFVLTVGSIHGGTSHNIIPGEVKLQMTLRTFSADVRKKALESIKRIAKGQAIAAGLSEEKYPKIDIDTAYIPATYNDPVLTQRIEGIFKNIFGAPNVIQTAPSMVGEDFGMFRNQGKEIPTCIFWLGTVAPEVFERSKKEGKVLPSLHSAYFSPLPEPSIKTGVKAMSSVVIDLFNSK